MKFSLYHNGIKNVIPNKEIEMKDFLELLKKDSTLLESIRKEKEKNKKNKLKEGLSYVTFAGTFKKRSNKELIKSSGFACFDIDDINNLKEIKQKIIKDKYTHLLFVSPSGNGLKCIVKIPEVKSDEEYKKYWLSLENYYKFPKNDVATKDISRACYLSVDKQPYFNSNSEVYTKKVEDISKVENIPQIKDKVKDETRSAKEFRKVMSLIRNGKTKEEIFEEMLLYSKWASEKEHYRNRQYDKALEYVGVQKEQPQQIEHEGELDIRTISDYRKLKVNKNYIVESFLYPKTLNMIYSPPAQFKSLLAEDMGLSISTGKPFLNLKTKKQPVLYCDGENADIIIKERLIQFHKGKNMKRWKIPFYILKNGILLDEKKQIHLGFLIGLEKAIEKYKIKVLIFDTLHRFAFYDENRADDINMLYTKVFRPLIEDYGLTIVFLHHSKKDGGYRGSGDFLGMVDVSYRIHRLGKTNGFNIINEKCRSGEIQDISGEINFGETFIRIDRLNEELVQEEKINKLKELTEKVKSIFEIGMELAKKDVETNLLLMEYEFSKSTLKRVLKYLVDNDFLDKPSDKKGLYRRIK